MSKDSRNEKNSKNLGGLACSAMKRPSLSFPSACIALTTYVAILIPTKMAGRMRTRVREDLREILQTRSGTERAKATMNRIELERRQRIQSVLLVRESEGQTFELTLRNLDS